MTGDELVAALQALPADLRALKVWFNEGEDLTSVGDVYRDSLEDGTPILRVAGY